VRSSDRTGADWTATELSPSPSSSFCGDNRKEQHRFRNNSRITGENFEDSNAEVSCVYVYVISALPIRYDISG